MPDQPTDKPADPAAMLARIAELLGLPPDAEPSMILDSLSRALAKPDPKDYVPVAAVQEMLRDRNARLAVLSEETAAAKVEDALRRGYITPGLRPWALALCRQDPDSFDAFMSGAVPAFAHLTRNILPAGFPDRPGPVLQSDAEAAICAQLGLKPGSLST